MRQMVKNLREMVGQISTSSRTVATLRRGDLGLVGADGERGRGPDELDGRDLGDHGRDGGADAGLARNAEALAANVDETSASIQQMSATLVQTAQNGEILLQSVERRRRGSTG